MTLGVAGVLAGVGTSLLKSRWRPSDPVRRDAIGRAITRHLAHPAKGELAMTRPPRFENLVPQCGTRTQTRSSRNASKALSRQLGRWSRSRPGFVVDVGCGHGTWLAAFQECGITDLTGIDGPWVKTEDILINATQYRSFDLAQPFDLERRFDLALSLEVAEHLAPASASSFVDSLVRLAPVVLFAAAIPGQGGVMHVNEQWPGYWVALFNERGYVAIDAIRPQIWDTPRSRVVVRAKTSCCLSNLVSLPIRSGAERTAWALIQSERSCIRGCTTVCVRRKPKRPSASCAAESHSLYDGQLDGMCCVVGSRNRHPDASLSSRSSGCD